MIPWNGIWKGANPPPQNGKGFLLLYFHRLTEAYLSPSQKCLTSPHWPERWPTSHWCFKDRGDRGNATFVGATRSPGRISVTCWPLPKECAPYTSLPFCHFNGSLCSNRPVPSLFNALIFSPTPTIGIFPFQKTLHLITCVILEEECCFYVNESELMEQNI